jgi:thioredoxin-dependent peroxiredoxin
MFVDDGLIKQVFIEPDVRGNPPGVGVEVSDADIMLAYLRKVLG